MSALIHYDHCPVCASADFREVFRAPDHSVTRELFGVCECMACGLRFTQDVPDADHIAPYYRSEEYISHTHSAKGMISRLYYLIRRRTLRKKRALLQRVTGLAAGRLLDYGSGTGAFAAVMQGAGWQVTGLEPDAGAREVARTELGMELLPVAALKDLKGERFDAITLWHVLEHVHELNDTLRQLRALLRPEGRLFIAVPNYTSWDARHYGPFWAAWDLPRHLYHFSPESMSRLLQLHGFELRASLPMWYDGFYISLLSNRYRSGKTRPLTAFWNGFRSNLKALGDRRACSSLIYVASSS
ncbi:MAG: hypothetical protein RJA57_255 [Bacteroidota bacterium]|jgi:SAM-dependent methyltransferase